MATFLELLQERVIVYDGAMGTSIQGYDLTLDDYWQMENCSEILTLSRPDVIAAIHRSYYAAGADVVETNSFGGSSLVLGEFGIPERTRELNLAAAMRLGWTGKLTGTSLFFTPLVWLGFAPTTVLAVVAINLLYQFWIHAPWIPTLGPFEWILNTPAHHSVHHASNLEYLDCNYGGVLIIFDRLFGTFRQEQAGIQIRYGLTERLYSYNPIKIALHEWGKLGRDLWSAKTWLMRIKIVFGPPGTIDKEYGNSANTIRAIKTGTSTS